MIYSVSTSLTASNAMKFTAIQSNTITGDVNTSLMIYSVSTSLTASNAMKFTAIQ